MSNNSKVDLNHLRELVAQQFDTKESQKINTIIESVYLRQDYARYHFHEFKNILSEINTDLSKLKMCFMIEDENLKNRIAIQAHISACIHSIHITHDILAYLIATVLNLNLHKSKIYFSTIDTKLQNYDKLYRLINDFNSNNDYKYLISHSNHIKHRFNIRVNVIYHFVGDKHYTAEFKSFKFNKEEFSKQNIEEFIIREFNREQKLIIEIENELISILQSRTIK